MILSFKKHPVDCVKFNSSLACMCVVEDEQNGVVSRSMHLKSVDSRDLLNKFKSSDFSVQNLNAIGAAQVLNTSFSGVRIPVTDADTFENVDLSVAFNS